jgi:hypothetical protein
MNLSEAKLNLNKYSYLESRSIIYNGNEIIIDTVMIHPKTDGYLINQFDLNFMDKIKHLSDQGEYSVFLVSNQHGILVFLDIENEEFTLVN